MREKDLFCLECNGIILSEELITSEYTMLGNYDLYLTREKLRIGIIGHRDSTMDQRAVAYDLGRSVIDHGNIVVSGLAEGIDTFAHVGGRYRTIAVLASIKNIFPKYNQKMAKEIVNKRGLLISPNETPNIDSKSFLDRDRLLVDMCDQIWMVGNKDDNSGGTGYTLRYAKFKDKKIEYF